MPADLVIGVGASSGADPTALADLVAATLADAQLQPADVVAVATVDLKVREPAIVALARHLDVEVRTYTPAELARQEVPTPSDVVAAAVGTPSVAEAAALLAAGPGAELVVPKRRTSDATTAIARRTIP
jgi:cobalamin biosynthesis protein CbiG